MRYIGMQVGSRHRLHIILCHEEVRRADGYYRVHLATVLDRLFILTEVPDPIVENAPVIKRVVLDPIRCQTGDELLALELFQAELVTGSHGITVRSEKGKDPFLHFELNALGILYLLVLDVFVLKINSCSIARWDNETIEQESQYGNHRCRQHIGHHQPLETDSGRKHRDDLGLLSQLRRKEYNRYEDEERAEKIGVVGNEVEIVIEYDTAQTDLRLHKVIDLLIDVEDDRNGYDQDDGEDERPQKLLDQILI